MANPQDLIKPKVATYLKSAWYVRWCIIAVVAVSFLFFPAINRQTVELLLVTASVYNIGVWFGIRHNLAVVTNRPLMLLADAFMALLLVINTGASNSPYIAILVFMIISGAYWYGTLVAVFIAVAQAIILIAQHETQFHFTGFPHFLIVQMLIMIAIGFYVSLLTKSERSERHQLISLGTETEKERQQLAALINNMQDAVLVVDNNDRIIISNQTAQALMHISKQSKHPLMHQVLELVGSDDKMAELKLRRDTAFERNDLRLRAPDGSLINMAISVAPYIVDRRNQGHVVILSDVSQDKTLDQERREFVAVASHELRTPLTIAQDDVTTLLSPPYVPKNEESVGMLNSALSSLRQLSHIIGDLTNLSAVESEKLQIVAEDLQPAELLRGFSSDYQSKARAKRLHLYTKLDPELDGMTVPTSSYVVREILTIYINNAIKFTDTGSVTIRAMKPDDGSEGVIFSVTDTGLGIAHSDKKKVFEKFFQAEDYETRKHGGTGLGLYIAKRLANRINARLWFESELGSGSTFYVFVPPYNEQS